MRNYCSYYISSTEGSDQNNGLSPETPWKTFAPAGKLRARGGDRLLLKCGDVWQEPLCLTDCHGSASLPFILSSYGEGARPSVRRYSGKVPMRAEERCVILNDVYGIVISGLDIGHAGVGIELIYNDSYDREYVLVEDCHFHDIYGTTQIDNVPTLAFSSALVVGGNRTQVGRDRYILLRGLHIHRCTTYDAGSLLGYSNGFDNSGAAEHCPSLENVTITDCICESNGYYGFVIAGVDGGFAEHCRILNNGTRSMPVGSTSIMLGACQNFIVRDCEILDQQRQDNDPDGCGIDFEHRCYQVTVERCRISGSAGVGIMFFVSGVGEPGANIGCKIEDCILERNNQNAGNIFGGEIYCVEHGLKNGIIRGNRYVHMDGVKFIRCGGQQFKSPADIFCSFTDEDNLPL